MSNRRPGAGWNVFDQLPNGPEAWVPLVGQRTNLRAGDLDFPVLAINHGAVQSNLSVMADYCRHHGVELSPHGKTTMMPWAFEQQLEAGAWGLTAATVPHCKTYRDFGVQRMLLANVLVDRKGIEWVSAELDSDPGFEFLCYVDSPDGVEILESMLRATGARRRIDVLVELGYEGGRTGCRSVEAAVQLARRVVASPSLTLRGVSGFEGFFAVTASEDEKARCLAYLDRLHELACSLHKEGALDDAPIVSAGGSAYFDLVIDRVGPGRFDFPVRTLLRSGCYVSHDSEMYESTSPLAGRGAATSPTRRLRPALELWATVWSRPEPELVIAGFGRRDAPWDFAYPRPEQVCGRDSGALREVSDGFAVTALNDQHAYMRVPEHDPVAVGDQIVLGVSHPCGAFDRWPWIAVVDDDHQVLGAARTFF